MGTGELVKLPGPRYFVEHFRKLGGSIEYIGKRLGFDDEFRVLDLVEGTGTVGQGNDGGVSSPSLGGGNYQASGGGGGASAPGGAGSGISLSTIYPVLHFVETLITDY